MDSGVKKANRFKRNYSAFLSVVFICIGFAFPPVLSGAESLPKEVLRFADMVLFNGKVLTANKEFTISEAVAVRDGKIMATGSTANILKMADQNTRRIDLEGRTVIPGLIDTHSHQFQYALSHWGGGSDYMGAQSRGFHTPVYLGRICPRCYGKAQ